MQVSLRHSDKDRGVIILGLWAENAGPGTSQTRYTPRPGTPPGPGTPLEPGTPPWNQVHHSPTRYTPRPGTPPSTPSSRTRYTPQDQVPPRPGTANKTRYTPPSTRHIPPLTRYTPQDQVHSPRTRSTPWPGTPLRTRYTPDQVYPPGAVHAGRYGQQVGRMHPTGMHSCYNYFLGEWWQILARRSKLHWDFLLAR